MSNEQDSPRVENTTDTNERNPHLPVAGLVGGPGYIEAQEAAGQRQLVEGVSFPVMGGQESELVAMGFVLGEPYADDPMFRDVKLPDGWSRKATDHSMHSVIVDNKGRERVGIFYKAAFYDRSASYYVKPRFIVGRNCDVFSLDRGQSQHQVTDVGVVVFQTNVEEYELRDSASLRDVEKRQSDECVAWLKENYPGHGDLVEDWSLARKNPRLRG